MVKLLSVILAVAAMAGLAAWLFFNQPVESEPLAVSADTPEESVLEAPVPDTPPRSAPVSIATGAPEAGPKPAAPGVPDSALPEMVVTRISLAKMNASAMQQMKEITPSTVSNFHARARTGDGEAAFALFHKTMACANAPETENALMGRIEDIYEGSQNNPDSEKMMDQVSEHFLQKYTDCEGFPRGLTGMLAAFDWLQIALDLRFPPAMSAYVTYGKSIIQQAALRHPELVLPYRDRVMNELQALLQTGLSEAFVAHSREYASGDLLEQDWFLSYVYAHAAGLSDASDNTADFLLREAERHLSPFEVSDARERARELCDRYCQ